MDLLLESGSQTLLEDDESALLLEEVASIDSLGPDFTIASRRLSWRRGRMYPLRSYDNEQ
jgi:hypothetical protein